MKSLKRRLTALIVGVLLFISVAAKGADVPKNVLKAESPTTKVYLYEGVPCTNEVALSIIQPSMAGQMQKGMIYDQEHSYEMCWVRVGEDVWASIDYDGVATIGHAEWAEFHKVGGI